MILLDTNVISELMRPVPDGNVVIWLDNQKGKDVWVCSITRAEIFAGSAMMPEGKRKQGLMVAASAMFDEDFASIVSERTRQGKPVSVVDAQIASIARSKGLSIATRNGKDFAGIEGLVVINPWLVNAR